MHREDTDPGSGRRAEQADSVLALVTSSGSTTIAVDTEPNTSGAAGATASQKRQVLIAAGGQRLAERAVTAATVPATRVRSPAAPGASGRSPWTRAGARTMTAIAIAP